MNAPALRYLISADDKASGVFQRVRREIADTSQGTAALRSSLGLLAPALAGALSVAGLVAFAKRANEGLLAIKDLSEATGASYKNISGLEQIALKTGGSFDTISTSLLKFNTALKDSSRTKEIGAAFKDLDLDVEKLKQLDPAEALLETAKAFESFKDNGKKARLAQELFGRSLKEVAPFLKELAEAGELNGRVTAEQIEQADKLNKSFAQLSANATNVAREVFGPLTAAINQVYGAFNQTTTATEDLTGAAYAMAVPFQTLAVLGVNTAFVFKGVGTEIGGIAAQLSALARGDFAGFSAIGKAMKEDAAAARKEVDALTARILGVGAGAQAAGQGGAAAKDTRPSLTATLGDVDKAGAAAAKKALEERRKLGEFAARQLVDIEEQAAQDAAEAWKFWERQQIDASDERAAAFKLQWQQVFEFIDEEQEREIEAGQAALKDLGDTGKTVGAEIGLVFSSAAGQAITQFEGVRGVLQGILADLAQIAIRETVTKPLSDLLSSSLSGFSFGSLFGGARAEGGPVAAGRAYLVGERGPELFMPRSNGTIIPNGAGGGVVINQVVNIGAGVSRNEVMAAMQATKQQTLAAIADSRRRGYAQAVA